MDDDRRHGQGAANRKGPLFRRIIITNDPGRMPKKGHERPRDEAEPNEAVFGGELQNVVMSKLGMNLELGRTVFQMKVLPCCGPRSDERVLFDEGGRRSPHVGSASEGRI